MSENISPFVNDLTVLFINSALVAIKVIKISLQLKKNKGNLVIVFIFAALYLHKMLFYKWRRFLNRWNQFSELNFARKFGTLHQDDISLFQRNTNTTRKIFQTSLLQSNAPIFLISKQTLIQKIQSSRERTNALKLSQNSVAIISHSTSSCF